MRTESAFGFSAAESAAAPMPPGHPVAEAEHQEGGTMEQIVVATDGSQSGRHAVDQALELAQASGAELTIVYVCHAPLPVLGDPYCQRSLSAELRLGNETVAAAAVLAARAGVQAQVAVLEGSPAEQILELARVRHADLIVVGSRGLGTIAGTLLGSVSREILQQADRPVLVAALRTARRQVA
jgi:nucleotide-binding universal stress UspA family protein